MKLHTNAQQLANKGRNGDTTLVHMTHDEVAGLDRLSQHLLGHPITHNPSTGLPEAGWLQDFFHDPAKTVSNTVTQIVKNPVPALIDIGLISMGVPPVAAGAITGGASAAMNHTDILKGALTGAAAGYVGGEASGAASGAGYGVTAASAAGGAAAGATGAVLSGQNPITGALTGGLAGTVMSQIPMGNGQTQVRYDDGSSLTYDSSGRVLSGVDSTGAAIPSTAISAANSAPVQNAAPVAAADVKNITDLVNNMQATNTPPAEMARILQANGYTADQVTAALGPGVAAQVDAAFTALNTDNASISDTVKTLQASGASDTAIAKALQAKGFTAEQTITALGSDYADSINQAYADATTSTVTAAQNPNGGLSNEDADFIDNTIKSMQSTGASEADIAKALAEKGYTADQVIAVTGPDTSDLVHTAYAGLNSGGVVTKVNSGTGTVVSTKVTTNGGGGTNTTGGGTNTTGGGTNTTGGGGGVVVPVIPTTSTSGGGTNTGGTYTYSQSPKEASPFTNGLVNPGLNPGMIQVTPAYQTNNPAQSQYYWGQHPYELGPQDTASYNSTPAAPATPWGTTGSNPTTYSPTGQPIMGAPVAPATRIEPTQKSMSQQIADAWGKGDYGTVNNLVNNLNMTTTQAQSLYGLSPGDLAGALSKGVNLVQPTIPGPAVLTGTAS